MTKDQIKKICEDDFQKGIGRCQLRNRDGRLIFAGENNKLKQLKFNCDISLGETIWQRRKDPVSKKYEFVQIFGD